MEIVHLLQKMMHVIIKILILYILKNMETQLSHLFAFSLGFEHIHWKYKNAIPCR